ncbi:N-acetylneuraminate synthase family protein [Candidatus Sumerlaeota bacterium]|nr:N-acetylneuraminate synthase family protein [Candidatus Sumerlaeota bacterium]
MSEFLKPYMIAETAYNHEGDLNYLMKMLDEIASLKLSAVKYHLLLDIASYFQKKHPLLSKLEKYLFTRNQWKEILQESKSKGLEVIALCDDVESVKFIIDEPDLADAIELHATGLNDYFQLSTLKDWRKKIILGIGGSTLDEIHYAVDFLNHQGNDDLLLMYGFQSYPTDYREINLSKMQKISHLFGLPAGYADHTAFDDPHNDIISVMGAMLGFPVLEKHFTCDPGVERVDYHAAVGSEGMRRISELMNLALMIHGTGRLDMSRAERDYGNTGPMKKALVAKRLIKKGETITLEDLWFKRTQEQSSLRQNQLFQVVGLKASEDIREDEVIDFSRIQYEFKAFDLKSFTHIKKDEEK